MALAAFLAKVEACARQAAEQLAAAYTIGPEKPERPPFIHGIIR